MVVENSPPAIVYFLERGKVILKWHSASPADRCRDRNRIRRRMVNGDRKYFRSAGRR